MSITKLSPGVVLIAPRRRSNSATSNPAAQADLEKVRAVKAKYAPLLRALSSRGVAGYGIGNAPALHSNSRKHELQINVRTQDDKDRLSGLIADKLDGVPVSFKVVGNIVAQNSGGRRAPDAGHFDRHADIPENVRNAMQKYNADMLALMPAGVHGFGYGMLPDKNGKFDLKAARKRPLGIMIMVEDKQHHDLLAGFLRKDLDGVPVGIMIAGRAVLARRAHAADGARN